MINRVPLIWLVLILLTIGSYTLADLHTALDCRYYFGFSCHQGLFNH